MATSSPSGPPSEQGRNPTAPAARAGFLAPPGGSKIVLTLLVLAGISARLLTLTIPAFQDPHAWRQYDTAAIARNFAEGPFHILYPQVDWRGNSPGYVESEFQIYTATVAVLYRLFGVHEWLGGAVNVAVKTALRVLYDKCTICNSAPANVHWPFFEIICLGVAP